METVVQNSKLLYNVCNHLEIPSLLTEQYPKALGRTVPEIKEIQETHSKNSYVFEKKMFSMLTEDVKSELEKSKKSQVLL